METLVVLLENGSLAEQQNALTIIATLPDSAADALLARELDLVCRISYSRTALIGEGEDPIRLTLDTELHATPAHDMEFWHSGDGQEISPGHAILELKYRRTPPPVFQELIETFSLAPQPVSKYRMAISAMGYCTQPVAPLISSQTKSEVSTL